MDNCVPYWLILKSSTRCSDTVSGLGAGAEKIEASPRKSFSRLRRFKEGCFIIGTSPRSTRLLHPRLWLANPHDFVSQVLEWVEKGRAKRSGRVAVPPAPKRSLKLPTHLVWAFSQHRAKSSSYQSFLKTG